MPRVEGGGGRREESRKYGQISSRQSCHKRWRERKGKGNGPRKKKMGPIFQLKLCACRLTTQSPIDEPQMHARHASRPGAGRPPLSSLPPSDLYGPIYKDYFSISRPVFPSESSHLPRWQKGGKGEDGKGAGVPPCGEKRRERERGEYLSQEQTNKLQQSK